MGLAVAGRSRVSSSRDAGVTVSCRVVAAAAAAAATLDVIVVIMDPFGSRLLVASRDLHHLSLDPYSLDSCVCGRQDGYCPAD
ncbi:hypothetical protein B0I35DRAFT_506699 [Stachybotrys elegans]|uniref:Uncharacterized protein n=1 Tax=Stachybotrys elegans TaxID=80388 RepID=A0A8K0T0A9_9HYPO|nr:hypothetical protein B0I35DRAFT_506699 [Stachybotrys elegans]